MSSLIQVSEPDAIVYISSTPFFGQLLTVRDISGERSLSNTIAVSTVGITFADGTFRKIIDTPYATITVDSFAKVVHQFPFTYGASEDAEGLTTERSLTVIGPSYIYDSLFSYGSISSLGYIDVKSIYVGEKTNSIATTPILVSTVIGIGHTYTSSILIPIDRLQSNGYVVRADVISTVVNFGTSYISVPALQSTIDGLGQYKYISAASLASTVVSLNTSYIFRSDLTSTVEGLGTFGYVSKADFLSTAKSFSGGFIRDSSYLSTIAGLATTNYVCTGQLGSTLNGLAASSYVSTGSLISTTLGLIAPPIYGFAPLYVSTTEGLGKYYISSATIVSTVNGLSIFNGSNLQSTIKGLGRSGYISTSQLTSTIEGLGNFYISSSVLTSTVGGLFNSNYTVSFVSTVRHLGTTGYLSTIIPMTSSILGYEAIQMTSTVSGAGSPYLSTTQLFSTVIGLSNTYATIPVFLSTVSGQTTFNTSNLVSTVSGLGSLKDGYVSTTQLFSTVSNVLFLDKALMTQRMTNLGISYFSTPSLFSTVQGLSNIYATPSNLISSIEGITSFNTSNLISTVCGLGSSRSYVSTTQLFSTVSGITTANDSLFSQVIDSLGSAPYLYISSPSLISTVQELSNIYIVGSNLVSSVADIAAFNPETLVSTTVGLGTSLYISRPHLISTVESVIVLNDLYYLYILPTLASAPFNYISTLSLSSTIRGLNSDTSSNGTNYVITSNLVSTIIQVNNIFSSNILSTNRGLRFIGQPPDLGGPPVVGSDNSLFWAIELMSSIFSINTINGILFKDKIATLSNIYITNEALASTVTALVAFSYLPENNQLPQLASTFTSIQASNSIVVGNYFNNLLPRLILNTAFISTVSTVSGLNTQFHVNLVNNLGLPPYSYISTASVVSTIRGLSNMYATVSATASTVFNIKYLYYPSTLVSTLNGLGNSGYVSSTNLFYTLSNVHETNVSATSSTIAGLASVSYISTASFVSTVEGLGNTYLSSSGLLSQVSTYLSSQNYTNTQFTSSIANLGTKGYYSTLSIISSIGGLGSLNYISRPQLLSTVVGISSIYATVSTLSTTTAGIEAVLLVSTLASTVAGLGSLGYVSSVVNPPNSVIIEKQKLVLVAATSQYNTSLGSRPGIVSYSNFIIPKSGATHLYIFQSNAIVPSCNIYVVGDGIQTSDIYCTQLVRATNDFRAKAFYCDGTKLNTSSDRRLKFDIVTLSNALESIRQIKGTSYRLIDTPERQLLGFLAQDIELVYPELIFQHSEYKSIKYDSIGVILLEAIKELNCECDAMLASLSLPYNKGV